MKQRDIYYSYISGLQLPTLDCVSVKQESFADSKRIAVVRRLVGIIVRNDLALVDNVSAISAKLEAAAPDLYAVRDPNRWLDEADTDLRKLAGRDPLDFDVRETLDEYLNELGRFRVVKEILNL